MRQTYQIFQPHQSPDHFFTFVHHYHTVTHLTLTLAKFESNQNNKKQCACGTTFLPRGHVRSKHCNRWLGELNLYQIGDILFYSFIYLLIRFIYLLSLGDSDDF